MEKQLVVNCNEDNRFEEERHVVHSCNRNFLLEDVNIFYVEVLGYFDDIIGQYYTICPNCGYIVMLDEKELSNKQKLEAKESYKNDRFQYRKNCLISQLINLESKSTNSFSKIKKRSLLYERS